MSHKKVSATFWEADWEVRNALKHEHLWSHKISKFRIIFVFKRPLPPKEMLFTMNFLKRGKNSFIKTDEKLWSKSFGWGKIESRFHNFWRFFALDVDKSWKHFDFIDSQNLLKVNSITEVNALASLMLLWLNHLGNKKFLLFQFPFKFQISLRRLGNGFHFCLHWINHMSRSFFYFRTISV